MNLEFARVAGKGDFVAGGMFSAVDPELQYTNSALCRGGIGDSEQSISVLPYQPQAFLDSSNLMNIATATGIADMKNSLAQENLTVLPIYLPHAITF